MAGSHAQVPSTIDPVLSARIEALQLLADRMCSRVMVVDRDLTIIYANETGWGGEQRQPRLPQPAKCYEAFLRRSDPCGTCPANEVFHSGEIRTLSCGVGGDGASCGMQQAFPLLSSDGRVESVLVLFGSCTRSGERPRPTAGVKEPSRGAAEDRTAELIGGSPLMRELVAMVRLVADSQATVLLQGESGTGKELVARTIHRLSPRGGNAFVVVDCSSLPETLLESELFGHAKGSFTGAVKNKKGLFEEADGGTIFLDEIADTSPQFQAKLLRVVQEGEIKPVGSNRAIRVDVRVISASNKDLGDLVKARAFREDLYYRLSVLPLILPPLRNRREDIPSLVDHFLRASCARHHRPMLEVTGDAMAALGRAPWPGNVRELQHAVERAVVTARAGILTTEDVLGRVPQSDKPADLWTVGSEAKRQAERERIVRALREASGNRSRAARLLGISRASLYNKIRIYGLV